MQGHVIIDGNNLLHAMHEHAPIAAVGRETLVRIVDEWARRGQDKVTIVFDGPPPRRELARQMDSTRVFVRFSAPATADDVIVDIVHRARQPSTIRVVTSDTAIRHEAKYRRCQHTDSASFVQALFKTADEPVADATPTTEKPADVSEREVREMMELLNGEVDEPLNDAELLDGEDPASFN